MIKPDGVQRGLVADIIGRFEKRGYKLVALKIKSPSKALLEVRIAPVEPPLSTNGSGLTDMPGTHTHAPFSQKHYEDLSSRPFFPKLVEYMLSGPVVCMVWEGKDAVKVRGRLRPPFGCLLWY